MSDKDLTPFDECAARCVDLFTQIEKKKSAPLLPQWTVKCTHLAT